MSTPPSISLLTTYRKQHSQQKPSNQEEIIHPFLNIQFYLYNQQQALINNSTKLIDKQDIRPQRPTSSHVTPTRRLQILDQTLTNQATNKPTKKPRNQPSNQQTNQAANKQTTQPTNQPPNQQTNQPTNTHTTASQPFHFVAHILTQQFTVWNKQYSTYIRITYGTVISI